MKKILLAIAGVLVVASVGLTLFAKHHHNQAYSETIDPEALDFYSVRSNATSQTYEAHTSSTYTFSIVDQDRTVQKDFALTHTELMHVIVVRNDLSSFQHLHPDFDAATGVFTLSDVVFPTEGEYRVFADFALNTPSKVMTLSEDLRVGDRGMDQPLATMDERTKTFGDVEVALTTHGALMPGEEQMLMFALTRDGQPVTDLEPYLGALGHSVILKEGTLDFIHAHPMEKQTQDGNVDFMVSFPSAGRYKVFTQFQRNGAVLVTDFILYVMADSYTPGSSSSHMDHSTH